MALLEKLVEKQKADGLTDRPFAEKMDITHVQWFDVRKGNKRFGVSALGRVLRKYPELEPEVLAYITDAADRKAAA